MFMELSNNLLFGLIYMDFVLLVETKSCNVVISITDTPSDFVSAVIGTMIRP